MTAYAKHFSTLATPQTEPVPGKPMVPNSGGGFGFAVDNWKRLERFLILGNDGGTYYATEKALTVENAQCVIRCLDEDGPRAISVICAISHEGRAPKNDPAIFALAIACGHKDAATRRCAEARIGDVCRIGTHIFQFAEAVQAFRGWGSGLRKAIAAWYTSKTPDQLAYQSVKYQQRNGWSHRDLLRLAHPATDSLDHDGIFRWIVGGKEALGPAREIKRGDIVKTCSSTLDLEGLPEIIGAFEEAKTASKGRVIELIITKGLTREMIPTEHLDDAGVWGALLMSMPLTALIRNLGKMTEVGLLKPMSVDAKRAVDRLADADYIKKSRLHPVAILMAAKVYAQGHGDKGKLKWSPVSQINDALDAAFYKAFANVEPSGKRTLLALDVSGSMNGSYIAGTTLSAREASACLAMVTAKTEPNYAIMAFSSGFIPIDISACSRLSDVIRITQSMPFDATNCSMPMLWASVNKIGVDVFNIYTDNETNWAGAMHPCQALRNYRNTFGIPAKLATVAATATGFTIADPSDAGMLDVCGFDTNVPAVLADFAR
jgi:60 kDa SS-A/Ro ribonucleoprotein